MPRTDMSTFGFDLSYLDDVADFTVNGPLYVPKQIETGIELLTVNRPDTYGVVLPAVVSRECEVCRLETQWWRETPAQNADYRPRAGGIDEVGYRCRNCGKQTCTCYGRWVQERSTFTYTKVGQFPQFQISPPKDLQKALSAAELELYKRGKTLRHHGYGIGALTYFRRLVEDTTNEMLDLLIDALEVEPDGAAAIDRVRAAKGGTVFEDKVKLAGDVLPARLRPGNVNPFHIIYDAVSDGLHRRSDEDCCAIVDKLDVAVTHVYRELKVHAKERKEYIESLKALMPKPAKP